MSWVMTLVAFCQGAGVSDAENALLQHRMTLRSAHVKVNVRSARIMNGVRREVRDLFDIMFDKNNVRVKRQCARGDAEPFRVAYIHADGALFHFSEERALLDGTLQSTTIESHTEHHFREYPTCDPRKFGLAPWTWSMSVQQPINRYVGNPGRHSASLRREIIEGHVCQIIEYETGSNAHITMWLDEQRGVHPIKLQARFQVKGKQFVRVVEQTLQNVAGFGWYPQTLRYTETIDGEVTGEELAKIEVVSFNSPMDKSQFTVVGLDLPQGEFIYETLSRCSGRSLPTKVYRWEGNSLVPANMKGKVDRTSVNNVVHGRGLSVARRRSHFWVLVCVGATVAVVALAGLAWGRRYYSRKYR